MTADTTRWTRGRSVYARNFGVDEQTVQRLMEEQLGAAFTAESYVAAGGPSWSGAGLTDRDRAVAVIAALLGQGVSDFRLQVYLDLARAHGIDDDGLTQLMILLSAYLGQPLAVQGMGALRERVDADRAGSAEIGE